MDTGHGLGAAHHERSWPDRPWTYLLTHEIAAIGRTVGESLPGGGLLRMQATLPRGRRLHPRATTHDLPGDGDAFQLALDSQGRFSDLKHLLGYLSLAALDVIR
jgi:hypothetical protein